MAALVLGKRFQAPRPRVPFRNAQARTRNGGAPHAERRQVEDIDTIAGSDVRKYRACSTAL
jgi:hypothetical protein